MAQDTSNEPKVPGPDAPSELPGFLGPRPADPPAPPDDGAPVSLRILLMATAILVVGFFLYREIALDGGAGGGLDRSTEYDWKVVAPDGSPVDLARYKGRPVLLNVWATWCGPCLMEMPSLAAISKRPELKEAGVAVVLVSTDGDPNLVRRFLDRADVGDADVLVAADAPPREFTTSGIPATFLISPDGTIVRREVGAMDWDTPEIASELAKLADEG